MKTLALALALAACSDDDRPLITEISEPRVLAILGEPSVLAVDGAVALQVRTVDAAGPRTGDPVRARVCSPWRFVAEPDRDCVGADALELETAADGTISVVAADVFAAFPPPAITEGLEVRLPVVAEVEVGGQTLVARRDLHVVAELAEHENPRLAEVLFDGVATRTLRTGKRYDLAATVDISSLDLRPDDPEMRLEPVDCYFYSPAGELEKHEVDVEDPEASPRTESSSYLAGAPGDSWLFIVVTDRTGGMSLEMVPLVVE